jgi:hypothetical protein
MHAYVILISFRYSRMIFLAHRLQFGFYFSFANQHAILLGDTSHTIIHAFYIYFAQAVGCHLYQESRVDFSLLHMEAMNMQLAMEALASMREEDDPFQLARAYGFLAMAFLYTHNLAIGKRYMRRVFEIVNRNNIRFVPLSGDLDGFLPIPEFSEDVHERAAFLSQMVYTEFDLQFVAGIPADFCFDLEDQFRYELPVRTSSYTTDEFVFITSSQNAYPILFRTCPIILRAKSLLLVKDANNLIASFYEQSTERYHPV